MKRITFILFLLFTCYLGSQAQRANVLATFQLIENKKYDEAKKAIELAIEDEKTVKWAKTWYARGLLCQTAYEKGIEDKDKKKYELYPDQLYVAYTSYQKALELNKGSRIHDQLEPLYAQLSNDFLSLGEEHYKGKKYPESLRAYEHALKINMSDILSVVIDTNLIYNTALAAYKNENFDASIAYLNQLNEMSYSPNTSHLLFVINIEKGDTNAAENTLRDGINRYHNNEDLVLLLVDHLYKSNQFHESITVLDTAIARSPEKYIFPYTKGLVYQKNEMYTEAIEAYFLASKVDPEQINAYANIGTCFYNIGVDIEKNARQIKNNKIFKEEKRKATGARKSAVDWLEKAHKIDPDNQNIKNQLIQLYKALQLNDKLKKLN